MSLQHVRLAPRWSVGLNIRGTQIPIRGNTLLLEIVHNHLEQPKYKCSSCRSFSKFCLFCGVQTILTVFYNGGL